MLECVNNISGYLSDPEHKTKFVCKTIDKPCGGVYDCKGQIAYIENKKKLPFRPLISPIRYRKGNWTKRGWKWLPYHKNLNNRHCNRCLVMITTRQMIEKRNKEKTMNPNWCWPLLFLIPQRAKQKLRERNYETAGSQLRIPFQPMPASDIQGNGYATHLPTAMGGCSVLISINPLDICTPL